LKEEAVGISEIFHALPITVAQPVINPPTINKDRIE
jgi:hypothetical protein